MSWHISRSSLGQHDDVEFLSLPLTRNKLLFGGALITRVMACPLVLRTEVLFQPPRFPAAGHGQNREQYQRQRDQDCCCDKEPTPDGHLSYLLRGGYPTDTYGNVNI